MEFFIYKFMCKNCDAFLIGVTKDVHRRRAQHASKIGFFFTKFKRLPGYARKANCVYSLMAKQFLRRKNTFDTMHGFHAEDCNMEILDTVPTEAEATLRESFFIQQNLSNPLCYNKQKESYYSSRHNFTNATDKTTKSATTA